MLTFGESLEKAKNNKDKNAAIQEVENNKE